jgi:hypothetical protein
MGMFIDYGWFLKNYKVVGTGIDEVSRKIESPNYTSEFSFNRDRYIPQVDFSDPSNFAYFGSAQQYYEKAIENIYRFYPYDGSLKEKLQWHNESSYFDNYVFEHEYPRTNGYIEIGETWGTISDTTTAAPDRYAKSNAPQYISAKGGPHAASVPTYTSGSYDKKLNFKEAEQKANIFDAESRQMQNFTIDGTKGNTVEFWMKLPLEPSKSQISPSHAYFDLWNGEAIGENSYGRFLIETRYNNSTLYQGDYVGDSFFHVTYMSGTSGVLRARVGAKELTGSLGLDLSNWNHWAFTVENTPGSTLELKLYANGNLIETTLTGSKIEPVKTGSFNATLGAYKHAPDSDAVSAGVSGEGYGSLSGSYLDEFRFWTVHRDSDDIKFNWFKQVAGGTNTDYGTARSKFYRNTNPVNLGVYYKFNEGITTSEDHDRVVLDYSGRVSNGYISNYTSTMRSTGSAIVEKQAALKEFKDPIIYKFHPDVVAYHHSASIKGREYDGRNSMFLQNMLPSWIIEEDEFKGKNQALYLNQILASYLDNLYLQIQKMPRLKDVNYVSGSSSGSMNKPIPFADRLLSNAGFVVPEIFANTNVFETLANRDDVREFERKLSDVKNQIYSNIYNNLVYINKSKGTIKSITNMMRCFGVDDDLYSINFYANNANLDLKGNFVPKTIRKSYANFSTSDKFGATVFQMTQSTDANSVSFITGSYKRATEASPAADGWDTENGFTLETEVIFPNYPKPLEPGGREHDFPHLSASLFGAHTAPLLAGDDPGDPTWAENDSSNFQVYAIREKANNHESESRNVRFILTSSNMNASTNGFISEMTSQTFKQVYDSDRWNLSVRVYPSKYPNIGYLSGSEDTAYTVQFTGFNMAGDTIKDKFDLTSELTLDNALLFVPMNKRIYVGAHRTNFTGSLLCPTNVKISSCRYWAIPLSNDELISHALDPKNYGVYNPMQTSHLLQDRGGQYPVDIPKIKSLWMNWDFDTVTGSDSGVSTGITSGEFSVLDFSSGSSENIYKSYISAGAEKSHTGRGVFFPSGNNQTGSISREYVYSYRQQVPENLNNLNAIKVLERDDEFFTKRTRPVSFSLSVEKSMYQNISEEMINFIAASQEASAMEDLIGRPVNKYRGRYKDLEKIRNLFFTRINNTPDVDKYIDYFKWLDTSISQMIQQVVPASSNFRGARNIIESHIFERSGKYRHKFPTIERVYPKQKKASDLLDQYQFNYLGNQEGIYDASLTSAIGISGTGIDGFNVSVSAVSKLALFSWQNNHANIENLASRTPATATMTGILDNNTIPAALDTETITIVDIVGLSKTYKFMNGGGKSNGDLDGGAVVVQLSGEDTKEGLVDNIEQAIESSNGHNGSIVVTRDGAVITLTERLAGGTGNGEILFSSGINTSTELSKTDFSGGQGTTGETPEPEESLAWWKNRVPFSADTAKTTGIAATNAGANNTFNAATAETTSKYAATLKATDSNPISKASRDVAVSLAVDSGGDGASYNDQNKSRPKKDRNFRNVVFNEAPAGSGTRLSFNTSTLARQPNTNTLDKIDPNRKFKPEFNVELPSVSTEVGVDGRKYAPISFQSSSTNNPFITGSSPWYVGYELSTQHLQDYYLDNKDISMQGPFTEQNVGGYAYRHSGIHLDIGQTLHVKPEAWYAFRTITSNPNGINFDFYNVYDLPGGVNAPRATMLREEVAKRPLNIKNIKSTTVRAIAAQTSLPPFNELGQTKVYNGNYDKDYQIIQIADRDVNNRYFVDSDGISTASAASVGTPSVSGAYDRAIPDRGKSEHIFVSKFSAPGGPEVNGQAFLNYEAETYSPYNAMTYRNLSVRQPLNRLLTKHAAFGGYDSVLGSGVAASATITGILDSASIPTALDTNTIIIIDAVGLSKTYKFMNGGGKSNGDLDGGAVVIQLSGENTKEGLVDNIEQAIESANGHNGSIIVSRTGAVITLTQETVGAAGNTKITFSAGINTSTELSKTNFFKGLPRIASGFHKTQRNARKKIKYTDIFGTATTSSIYDNYYVQHQIPQSDRQYAWITASATTTPLGFSQKDYANRSFASTDIAFVTSSDFGAFINTSLLGNGKYIFGRPASSAGALFLPQDFIGLNNFTYLDADEMDNNTVLFKLNTDFVGATIVGGALGSTTPVEGLNINLLKGNGPYGQSSWKQIQHSYHPIVRYMKGINRFSILTENITTSPGDLKQQFLKTQTLQNFTEPMVTFKYKPLEHDLEVIAEDEAQEVIEIDSTFSNDLSGFANNKIDLLLNYKKDIQNIKLMYNSLKNMYLEKNIPITSNPIGSLQRLSYREVVYPRERNTALAKTRGRQNYTVSSGSSDFNLRLGDSLAFWKNNINDRLRSDAEARNAQGLIIASGSSYFGLTDMSIWPLDSEEPFYDLYAVSASITDEADPFYWAPLGPSSSALTTARAPRLADVNKNGELSYAGYIYGLFGINIQSKVTGSGDPSAAGPFPNYLANLNFKPTASFQYEFPNMMMSGTGPTTLLPRPTASLHLMAPYRTDVLSGKTPWFNSYEGYSEDIRRLAKDYTVIPEFRITDHIDYYLKEGFFADNNKFLDIIGSSLANTSSATNNTGSFQSEFFKVYSHTDFMKHFSVIQEEHKKDGAAFVSKIRLQANAVKKLLPYQGFYPALRSVQLGQLFSSSYAPYITGSNVRDGEQERLAALYQPFFAPGIFFNTIKSGIAVSYPVHTGSAPDVFTGAGTTNVNAATSGSIFISNQYQDAPNYLFPFEAILDPDQFLPVSSSLTSSTLNTLTSSVFMVYPNFTGSARTDDMDGFYAKQGIAGVGGDDPYTAARAAALGVNRNQPQIFFQWKGQSDPKYSLAASNFFAESVDFFLENGSLTSFVSKPEKDFKSMVSGSAYFMDVLLYKTDDFVSYEGPSEGVFEYRAGLVASSSLSPSTWHTRANQYGDGLVNTTIGARGMHYGPSYKASPHVWGSSGTGSVPYAAFRAQDPTYAPHTPPYFYGTSRARIVFKPHVARDMGAGEAAKFTLEEILSNAKVETSYQNENERAKTLQENNYRLNNPAGKAQMQLSSSINLFGQTTLKEVEYGVERGTDGSYKAKSATTPVVQGTNDAWIIETKFECPSINLAHMDTASLGAGIGDGKEKYHTRGIWKGYGIVPSGSEGIFLQLKESYPQITNSMDASVTSTLSGSLIEVCGFKATSERVGKMRSKKIISEAIVAVPIDEKGNFFSIDKDMFAKQKSNLEAANKALLAGDFGVEMDIGETSITKMIQKMKRFSLPPQMDFINNPNTDPFVMYIFDFNHSLDKQDLSDIWQNLMPKISTTAEKDSSVFEHKIGLEYEFFGQYKKGNLPDNIRWMVFKVKQKARNNYFNITQQSEVAKGFNFTAFKELQGVSSNPEAELLYSYNWPYDFFSLVELAQIESEVIFEPPKE